MTGARALALGSLSLLLGACTAFPDIPNGECGNSVIEAPEDCDTFPPGPGLVCRPKGADDECHLDCAPRDNHPGLCPTGWGCDESFVCRQPGTGFDAPTSAVDVGAWSLAAADFDGDLRADVMSSEPLDSVGETRVRFFYFDQQGALADTREFPKLLLSPTIKDVSGDRRADVAFADYALGVMLGRADRSWVPETFSSYRVPGSVLRVVPVSDNHIGTASPILPLIGYAGGSGVPAGAGFFVADPVTAKLGMRAHIADSIAALIADPVSGNIFEDPVASPCFEPVVALRGATHFTVVDTCLTDASGLTAWRPEFEQRDIALVPPAAIDASPLVVDMNGDGHLDVLIGARGKPYVSYGDGEKLAPAVPFLLRHSASDQLDANIPMPLAVGELTGDHAPDFVFQDHLLLSARGTDGELPVYSDATRNLLGSPWTFAQIADFNGNGKPDLVTGSNASLNLEFYNGTGTPFLTETLISTAAPVQFLTAGDYDGDLINDIALFEQPLPGQSKSTLKIAFGAAFAPPSAAVTVAQVTQPDQISSYADKSIGNLVVTSSETLDGMQGGELTFLDGSGDRVPFASFALTDFVANGNIEDSEAFAVAAGNFSAQHGNGDLLALAFPRPADANEVSTPPAQPWLLPAVETPGTYTQRLANNLDRRLNPLVFSNKNARADVVSAAADLDGDGLDEAIFAMPAGANRDQCGILIFGVGGSTSGSAPVVAHTPTLLHEPCTDPQLVAVDADGDGAVDLALLTGQAGSAGRKLYLLWNDGAAGFSAANATLISRDTDSPQAFSALPGTIASVGAFGAISAPGRPFGFAYVTQGELVFVAATDTARSFADPVSWLVDLNGGTGIVAADVNGDRVSDLVIAESGKLRVLKAQLQVP